MINIVQRFFPDLLLQCHSKLQYKIRQADCSRISKPLKILKEFLDETFCSRQDLIKTHQCAALFPRSSFAVSCQVAIRGESRAIRVLLKCIMWLSAPRRRGCWGRCEAGRRTVAAPQHLFKDQMASAHDGEDGNLSICFTPWRSHPTRCKYKVSKYLRTHKYGC